MAFSRKSFKAILTIFFFMGTSTSFAANEMAQTFNYQGQFFNELGTAPLLDTVDLTLEIFDPSGTCLLYSEQQNNINLSSTNGMFAIQVGSLTGASKRTIAPAPANERDPGLPMEQIFGNLGPVTGPITNCAGGYTPSAGDGRILRVIVDDLTTSTTVTLSPDLPISAAPQSLSAQTLQGFIPSNFINVDTHMTQAAADLLTSAGDASSLHNHDSLYVKLATAATQNLGTGITYTTGDLGIGTSTPGGALEVDPTAAQTGEIIKAKNTQTSDLLDIYGSGGTLAVSVNAAGVLSVGGNAVATTSTLGSYLPLAGGALTGPVTNSSSYTTTAGVYFKNGANTVGFLPPSSAPASNLTWTLPSITGGASTFLQNDGAGHLTWAAGSAGGITSLDGLTGATQTFATTELVATSTAPLFTASGTVHTLNIPMASSATVTAGLLSNTDYATFNGKAGGSANLVDVNTLTKVSASGVVGEATGLSVNGTANVTSLISKAGSAQSTNDYADWENNSGTVQYSLNSSGIPSATTDLATVAYVTSAVTSGSSQWTTSAPNIYYNTGSVSVGTATPEATLTVQGKALVETSPMGFAASNTFSLFDTTAPSIALIDGVNQSYINDINGGGLAFATGGNNERMRISQTGKVGIGTTSPNYNLDIQGNDSNVTLNLQNNSSTATRYPQLNINNFAGTYGGTPVLNFMESRGSAASPASIQANDQMGTINFSGYDGSTDAIGATISGLATDPNWSSGMHGTEISFATTANGSSAYPATRMVIDPAGAVWIGMLAPNSQALLNVAAGSSTVAPMIIWPGTNLSTPVSGAIENDGTNLYYTDSSAVRHVIAGGSGSGTLSGLTSGDILFATGGTSAGTGGNLTWSNSNYGMVLNASNAPAGDALQIDNSPHGSATTSLLSLGPSNISGGNASGTYLGVNAANGYAGDLINMQVNGTQTFKMDNSGDFWVGNTGNGSGGLIMGGNGSPGAPTFSFNTESDNGMYLSAVNTLGFSTNGNERMRIDPSGNVGVGTTTPLIINGVNYAGSMQAFNFASSTLPASSVAAGAGGGSFVSVDSTAPANQKTWASGTGLGSGTYAIASYNDAGAGTTRFLINQSGEVGIGNPSPSTALDVNGQVRSISTANGGTVYNNTSTSPGTAIDWNNGNVQTTAMVCDGSTATPMIHLYEGGSYTLIVTSTTSTGLCSFTTSGQTPNSITSAGNWRFVPANTTPTSSSQTVYTILVAGAHAYVSWISGF